MTMSRFVYSLVRYVPDYGRGEFVNIGAIVGSEDLDQWDIRTTNQWGRLKALDRTVSVATVNDFLRPLLKLLEDNEASHEGTMLSETVLSQLSNDHRSAIQVAPPKPLLAEDVESALDLVFDQLVPNEARGYSRGVGRRTVRKRLRTELVAANMIRDVDFREEVQVVAEQGFDGGMDFAITNGEVKGFVQAWSFDVQDREALRDEIRSWGFLVEKVRSGHSVVNVGTGSMRVADNAQVDALYVAPRDSADPVYIDAIRVFNDLRVEHRPMDRASEVAARARALLNHA
jgi:hypothetical protein